MAKMGPYGGSVQKQGGSGKGNGRKQTYMSGTGKGGGSNDGACSGLKMSNEMRSDMKTTPTHKNPFPKGLA